MMVTLPLMGNLTMSSCRFCDTVAVFDDGRIVQTGSHETLLKDKDGIYCRMWEAQAQYYI